MSEIPEIDPEAVAAALDEEESALLLDVRTTGEFAAIHAAGAQNTPLNLLRAADVGDRNRPIYVICRSGRRSRDGARMLQERGYSRVSNVTGGTSRWLQSGLPTARGTADSGPDREA